jgi:alkanesulfonate monooxygenase
MAVSSDNVNCGIRVGIITRETEEEAWRIAHARFPGDRKGELTHKLAMKTSDSVWHKELSKVDTAPEDGPYWLLPFQNYKTFCPYLVGSYDRVALEVGKYLAAGYRTFIVDIPASEEELLHTTSVFQQAQKRAIV